MTDQQKQAIRALRQKGLSYHKIAELTGLSPNTIKSFCRRNNTRVLVPNDGEQPDVCKNCGLPLEQNPSTKRKSYCNNQCRSDWWNQNRWWARPKSYRLICHHCGVEFNSYGNNKRKFCGRDCYLRSRYGEGLP